MLRFHTSLFVIILLIMGCEAPKQVSTDQQKEMPKSESQVEPLKPESNLASSTVDNSKKSRDKPDEDLLPKRRKLTAQERIFQRQHERLDEVFTLSTQPDYCIKIAARLNKSNCPESLKTEFRTFFKGKCTEKLFDFAFAVGALKKPDPLDCKTLPKMPSD